MDVTERTLILIKPDAIKKDVWLDIIRIYCQNDLIVETTRIFEMSRQLAEEFYSDLKEHPVFERQIEHMTSGPIIALILSGEEAIRKVRELNGATNPANAKEGTVRNLYGVPNGNVNNAVHASDSEKSFLKESELIFTQNRP